MRYDAKQIVKGKKRTKEGAGGKGNVKQAGSRREETRPQSSEAKRRTMKQGRKEESL